MQHLKLCVWKRLRPTVVSAWLNCHAVAPGTVQPRGGGCNPSRREGAASKLRLLARAGGTDSVAAGRPAAEKALDIVPGQGETVIRTYPLSLFFSRQRRYGCHQLSGAARVHIALGWQFRSMFDTPWLSFPRRSDETSTSVHSLRPCGQ